MGTGGSSGTGIAGGAKLIATPAGRPMYTIIAAAISSRQGTMYGSITNIANISVLAVILMTAIAHTSVSSSIFNAGHTRVYPTVCRLIGTAVADITGGRDQAA